MLTRISHSIVKKSSSPYQYLSKILYEFISSNIVQLGDMKFINYGYASESSDKNADINYYSQALYRKVISEVNFNDSRVAEIGCGRGGGCELLMSYSPKSVVGIDRSKNGIKFCKNSYSIPGLSFVVGDAQDLPFIDEEFDYLVNVESSHNYNNRSKFFSEVMRVLKPGGLFLYADFITREYYEQRIALLKSSGFEIIVEDEITDNVLRALHLTSSKKEALLNKNTLLRPLRKGAREFVGTKGTVIYNLFESKKGIYFSLVCRKKATDKL